MTKHLNLNSEAGGSHKSRSHPRKLSRANADEGEKLGHTLSRAWFDIELYGTYMDLTFDHNCSIYFTCSQGKCISGNYPTVLLHKVTFFSFNLDTEPNLGGGLDGASRRVVVEKKGRGTEEDTQGLCSTGLDFSLSYCTDYKKVAGQEFPKNK